MEKITVYPRANPTPAITSYPKRILPKKYN
jgi:hypothetical protein